MAHYIFFRWGEGLKWGKHSTECVFKFKFVGRLAMSARGSHKRTSGIWDEFENKTRTTVECFPHFTSLFCSHTRYCNSRSNRFFHSPVSLCQHLSSHKTMSFHRPAPRRSKFMLHELRTVVEEREFSGNFFKCLKWVYYQIGFVLFI